MDYNTQNTEPNTEPGVQRTETVTQNVQPTAQRTETVTQNVQPAAQRTETVTQQIRPSVNTEPVSQQTQTVKTHTENLGARNIVGAFFGLVEILIGFRFVLKLFGANTGSGFVQFMNGITGFFVNLFKGIFAETSIGSGNAVFEPASIIAMIVVALIAWFVFKLMTPKSEKRTDQTSFTSNSGTNQR
ncbi:MAG: hypothetical protein ACYCYM_09940 [Saccharofermentanales bacterium]